MKTLTKTLCLMVLAGLWLVSAIPAQSAETIPAEDAAAPTIRTETQRVVVPVAVFSRAGEVLDDLDTADFRLFVDDRTVPDFGLQFDRQMPAVVHVLVDFSSSQIQDKWPWVKSFLKAMIHRLTPRDTFVLAGYGWRYQVICGPTTDRAEIMETLDNLYPELYVPRHGLWDSIKQQLKRDVRDTGKGGQQVPLNKTAIALDKTMFALADETNPKKYIILVSDGDENLSKVTLNHLQKAGVPVFSVYLSGSGFGRHSLFRRGAFLQTIAEETGGVVFRKTSTLQPDLVARQTADMMRNHYLISFTPAGDLARDDTHRIRVEVDRPNIRTDYRRSFRFSRE
ncbi:MAG: VWA domain-containing protein [Acidobacteria bacterium]|nr:VWA domain-containing protein [Acidobacteriota bacterium]